MGMGRKKSDCSEPIINRCISPRFLQYGTKKVRKHISMCQVTANFFFYFSHECRILFRAF
jgi:hypothetical protein